MDDCSADDFWESDQEEETACLNPLSELKVKLKPIGSDNLAEIQESLYQLRKQHFHLQIKVKDATERKLFSKLPSLLQLHWAIPVNKDTPPLRNSNYVLGAICV